jgi:hypothetical protein
MESDRSASNNDSGDPDPLDFAFSSALMIPCSQLIMAVDDELDEIEQEIAIAPGE